jgi:hypothetical protein
MNQQGLVVHQQEPFVWLGDMKRKYVDYQKVDIPPWLEDQELYKLGDWKAFKKPRNDVGKEWVGAPSSCYDSFGSFYIESLWWCTYFSF